MDLSLPLNNLNFRILKNSEILDVLELIQYLNMLKVVFVF